MTLDTTELRRLHGAATVRPRNLSHGFLQEAMDARIELIAAIPELCDAADELARVKAVMGSEETALQPFADLADGAKAAFPNDRVAAGDVCRSSVSFTDFERATAALAALRELIARDDA